MKSLLAYKLLRVRKDGSLGPLFINCRQRIKPGKRLKAEAHRRKGYAFRPGWHCTAHPSAPHLSMKGRAWFLVRVRDYEIYTRPASQGGKWILAQEMCVLGAV
jgi:hypothetical protein